ncbi:MAG: hypothetical protein U9Q15_02285 [Patescibacteria group bacterium]|nr:hypothetical protein [Patescibacteria group bacterium]
MIDILKIQDIKINQHGIIQAILNYGIVSFILTSGEVSKVARFVPDPYHLVEHIHRIKLQKET